jgi:hypothetical protein
MWITLTLLGSTLKPRSPTAATAEESRSLGAVSRVMTYIFREFFLLSHVTLAPPFGFHLYFTFAPMQLSTAFLPSNSGAGVL